MVSAWKSFEWARNLKLTENLRVKLCTLCMRQRAHLSTNYCVSETLNHFCSLLKTPLPLFKACLHDCAAALAVKNWSRVGPPTNMASIHVVGASIMQKFIVLYWMKTIPTLDLHLSSRFLASQLQYMDLMRPFGKLILRDNNPWCHSEV